MTPEIVVVLANAFKAGCESIAAAIFTAAIIRALFNK